MITNVNIRAYGGAGYNLMNTSEVLRFVSISVEDDNGTRHQVEQSWKDGDEPDADGSCPSELLPEIKRRLKSWLYFGDRAKDLETIAWMEANIDAIDIAWYEGEAKRLRERAAKYIKGAEQCERVAANIREDVADRTATTANITPADADVRPDTTTL